MPNRCWNAVARQTRVAMPQSIVTLRSYNILNINFWIHCEPKVGCACAIRLQEALRSNSRRPKKEFKRLPVTLASASSPPLTDVSLKQELSKKVSCRLGNRE